MIGKKQIHDIAAALQSDDVSTRLQEALWLGMNPQPEFLDLLVDRCSVESDFSVREQLTWSIIRFPKELVVPKLVTAVSSNINQARSQALHTLSKIEGADAWFVITKELLNDPCDEVAQAAWRAAVTLVPSGEEHGLASDLSALLGRGGREVQRSLSVSLAALGEATVSPVLKKVIIGDDEAARDHALFTQRIFTEPDLRSDYAVDQVKILLAPRPKD